MMARFALANDGVTKREALLFFLPYPVIVVLCCLTSLLYEKLLKRMTSEPVRKSRTKLRLDLFICGFLAQSLWTVSLTMSTEYGILVGISGPIWYAIAAELPMILFVILLVRFRMIAPGARTFLHVVYVRFGRIAHILLCALAIFYNLTIIANIIRTGNEIFSTISSNVEFDLVWFISFIIAGICVSGVTFRKVVLVSGIGTVFILITTLCFYVGVFFMSSNPNLGSIEKIYETNLAAKNLYDGYFNRLTVRNPFALILALKKFLSNAFLFMDQSSWQMGSFAEPGKESSGVIVSEILWMAIPYAFGTACSVGFVSLTPQDELSQMTESEIATIPAVITANTLFGRDGLLLLFASYAFIMANISVFQLFSISSILTYDIYAIHLRPFRVCYDLNCCLLCGKTRDSTYRPKENCTCIPMSCCKECKEDQRVRSAVKESIKPPHKCKIHAEYIRYEERLNSVRHMIILLVLSTVLPLGILFRLPGFNISALSEAINSILAITLGPIIYTFFWDGMTSAGVIIGTILSALITMVLWFELPVLFKENQNLLKPEDISEVTIYFSAIILGFTLPALVVCIERIWKKKKHTYEASTLQSTWARIYELDNPLNPWTIDYAMTLSLTNFNVESYSCPSVEDVKRAYRCSWYFALSSPFIFCFFYIGVMPGLFGISDVIDLVTFKIWVSLILILLLISTAVATFMPIVFEGINLYRLRRTKSTSKDQEFIIPRIEYSEAQDDTEIRGTPHSEAEN